MEDKNYKMDSAVVLSCLFFSLFVITFLSAIDTLNSYKYLKAEAISKGYAEYNNTNGNWQWKTNK